MNSPDCLSSDRPCVRCGAFWKRLEAAVTGAGQPRPPLTEASPAGPPAKTLLLMPSTGPPRPCRTETEDLPLERSFVADSALSAITTSTDSRCKRDPSLVGNRGGRRDKASLLPANLTPCPCKAPKGRGLQQLEHLFIANSTSSRYETHVQEHLQPFEWSNVTGFTLHPSQGQLLGRNGRIGAWLRTPLYQPMAKPRSLPRASIEMWQKPPGSHSKALSSHRLHPGCEGVSLGQSREPLLHLAWQAEKGVLGAAPWLTAQEQSHFQENWEVLIQRC